MQEFRAEGRIQYKSGAVALLFPGCQFAALKQRKFSDAPFCFCCSFRWESQILLGANVPEDLATKRHNSSFFCVQLFNRDDWCVSFASPDSSTHPTTGHFGPYFDWFYGHFRDYLPFGST